MMDKERWLLQIFTAISLVVFVVFGLMACASSGQWKDVSYSGEDSKVLVLCKN